METLQDATIIAEMRMNGATCREIAKQTGIHFTTIARRLTGTGETKAFLDKLQSALTGRALARAYANLDHSIHAYLKPDTSEPERERGFKASIKVLEAHGLLPTHSPSIFVQNQLNIQISETPAVVNELFSRSTHKPYLTSPTPHEALLDADVIDLQASPDSGTG
jgi:hypothetical protein